MQTLTSADGTPIAYAHAGTGPAVVFATGAFNDHTTCADLAALLARDHTVVTYDRRARGRSGDTAPYAIEREIEDIGAVIEAAGGTANLYGTSSGAALALDAAAEVPVTKLALWEPPYILDESNRPPTDQVEQYHTMVAEGRRGDAVEYFMTRIVHLPPEFVAQARTEPWWASQEALAHTLAYDATIMGDYSLPTETAGSVKAPTLVLAGGSDYPWMRETALALAEALPDGATRMLDGQGHNVDLAVLGPALKEFFAD